MIINVGKEPDYKISAHGFYYDSSLNNETDGYRNDLLSKRYELIILNESNHA